MLRLILPLLLAGPAATAAEPVIALIIDDLGYRYVEGARATRLPGPVVCAVLPETPQGKVLAELANANGKEVLLHLPMQAVDADLPQEPWVLSLDDSHTQVADRLAQSLGSVPHAIGINGHRGSLLTRHPGHMRWLMDELEARDLLFVDSYTTHHSVAIQVADEVGVPATRRNVFLDHNASPARIRAEFERLVRLAQRDGSAVAIGHPYPVTLTFLEDTLPDLDAYGVKLVGIRELIAQQARRPEIDRASAVDNERPRHVGR
ncbi:MAG: divergent polysaccharide deacetylase family protein [Pseudomonadota bacterium]